MADEKKAPESPPSVKQVEIAGAIFDRRPNGGLVIITPGGTDPAFDADQVDEIRDFFGDSDKWVTVRAKLHKEGEVQIAKAAAAREAAGDEPVVVAPVAPRAPRPARPAPHAAADAKKAAAAKAKSEAEVQAKATADAKVSAAREAADRPVTTVVPAKPRPARPAPPRAATAAEEKAVVATVKAKAKRRA